MKNLLQNKHISNILEALGWLIIISAIFFFWWVFSAFVIKSNKPIFHDGDTFKMYDSSIKKIITCRLSNIDAPELSQPYGINCRDSVINLVYHSNFTYKIIDTDIHGRFVAECYVNSYNLDSIMTLKGWCWVYTQYNHNPNLIALQQGAFIKHKGLWSLPNPINPSVWRHTHKSFFAKNN
jgi:micrococcal nuclease